MGLLQDGPAPGEPALDGLDLLQGVPVHLLEGWTRQEYVDGAVLLASGADADRIMVLIRGFASVVDGPTEIAMRLPGSLLGEQAFIDEQPRSATVLARGSVVTYEVERDGVLALFADPTFSRNLIRELSRKLREATGERGWKFAQYKLLFGAVEEFVAPAVLQELLAKRDLGQPRRADAVVLFADIANFTGKTLEMTPEDLNRDLSAFLDLATELVVAHGGIVDKFIGDEVMGVWGYAAKPEDGANAFLAAEELVRRAAHLTLDGQPLRIGVGIERGSVMLGVYGNKGKRQFTAIGPSVNLAARLQGQSRAEDAGPICVGPDLAEDLPPELRAKLAGPITKHLHHVGDTAFFTYDPKE